jgi:hypothetical protein
MDLDLQTGEADLYLTFDHEKVQATVPPVKYFCDAFGWLSRL